MLELAPDNPTVFQDRVLLCGAIVVFSQEAPSDQRRSGNVEIPPTPSADDIIRFGSFEVDPGAGELRRSGLRIRLGGQPFDVLVTLLQKPGQVVTREELHQKLWAHDTFVDFEHGLNKAINKVREALGDVADNPRFIETLPRRGYRFLAPVIRPAPEMSVADTFAEVKEP